MYISLLSRISFPAYLLICKSVRIIKSCLLISTESGVRPLKKQPLNEKLRKRHIQDLPQWQESDSKLLERWLLLFTREILIKGAEFNYVKRLLLMSVWSYDGYGLAGKGLAHCSSPWHVLSHLLLWSLILKRVFRSQIGLWVSLSANFVKYSRICLNQCLGCRILPYSFSSQHTCPIHYF